MVSLIDLFTVDDDSRVAGDLTHVAAAIDVAENSGVLLDMDLRVAFDFSFQTAAEDILDRGVLEPDARAVAQEPLLRPAVRPLPQAQRGERLR